MPQIDAPSSYERFGTLAIAVGLTVDAFSWPELAAPPCALFCVIDEQGLAVSESREREEGDFVFSRF